VLAIDTMGSGISWRSSTDRAEIAQNTHTSPQDDARSYRSKVDAMRYLLKNIIARRAFESYLKRLKTKGEEYLQCYIDLEELKIERDIDKIVIANTFILSKYNFSPTITDSNSIGTSTIDDDDDSSTAAVTVLVNKKIWDKLEKLRETNLRRTNRDNLIRLVLGIQHQMLNELIDDFNIYLDSKDYKDWKKSEMRMEKQQIKAHTTETSISFVAAAVTTNVSPTTTKETTSAVPGVEYTNIVT